jgi:hypothetical protein
VSTSPSGPPDGPTRRRVHHAPRYRSFLLAGVVVGLLAALAVTLAYPPGVGYSRVQVFGFLAVSGGLLGALLGGGVAVLLDRRR